MAIRHLDNLEDYVELHAPNPPKSRPCTRTSSFASPVSSGSPRSSDFQAEGLSPDHRGSGRRPGAVLGAGLCHRRGSLFPGDRRAESRHTHLGKKTLQVFATDISQQVIDKARLAIYPEGLRPMFRPNGSSGSSRRRGWLQSRGAFEKCVFARHTSPGIRLSLGLTSSVLERPHIPGSAPAAQGDSFPSLRASSRRVPHARGIRVGGRFTDLFSLVDKKAKVYPRGGPRSIPPSPGPVKTSAGVPAPAPVPPASSTWPKRRTGRAGQICPGGSDSRCRPADSELPRACDPYLEPGPGGVSFDLVRMAREGLAGELSGALKEAKEGGARLSAGRPNSSRRTGGRRRFRCHPDRISFRRDLVPRPVSGNMPTADEEDASYGNPASARAADGASRQVEDLEGELSEIGSTPGPYSKTKNQRTRNSARPTRNAVDQRGVAERQRGVGDDLKEVQSANEGLRPSTRSWSGQ